MVSIDSILAEKGLIKQDILNTDKFALDKECIEHPQIYDIVGELVSYLEGERDSVKLDKEELWAQKAINYRKLLEAEGTKTSDPKIEQLVTIDPEYKKVSKKYLELKLKCDLLKNVKESLDKKTKQLDNLTYLFNSNYFTLNVGREKEGVKELKVEEKRKLIRRFSVSPEKIPIL